MLVFLLWRPWRGSAHGQGFWVASERNTWRKTPAGCTWRARLEDMPGGRRLEDAPGGHAWRMRLEGMPGGHSWKETSEGDLPPP